MVNDTKTPFRKAKRRTASADAAPKRSRTADPIFNVSL
jgi:hypothetical protein